MAEAFLNQLPRVGRGILKPEDQRCLICMEHYGTTPSANGTIERAVRLPCSHTMGSECIATWLLSSPANGGTANNNNNNTCPLCRHVLFHQTAPVRSPPLGSGPVGEEELRRIQTVLQTRCVGLCALLELSIPEVGRLARLIADALLQRVDIRGEVEGDDGPVYAVAAACVYTASQFLRDSRSLGVIAGCFDDVGVGAVRWACFLLRRHLREIVDALLLVGVLEEGPVDGGFLPAAS